MKKIMRVSGNITGEYGYTYFDVSTTELLNQAYKYIWKHSLTQSNTKEYIDDETSDKYDLTIENCDLCDQTGIIYFRDRSIICPDCKGNTNKVSKRMEKYIERFNQAKKGDLKAIKKLIEEDVDWVDTAIIKIKATKG